MFEHVGKAPAIFSLTSDRITTLPQGLAGGEPGRIGKVVINGEEIFLFPGLA